MKYAVVTGSTKGIGKQIGIDLLKRDYYVFFNYGHDDNIIKSLEKELSQVSNCYKIIKNDFSTFDDIKHFVSEINTITDVIDVLILNAGITDRTTYNEMTIESFNNVLMTNITAPCFLAQQFKQHMRSGGNIVFIGSIFGEIPHSVSISYAVTKSAVHMLAKALVKEFCESKVRVNTVAPGFTETAWQKNKPEKIRKNIESKISLHRFATPNEISDAVMFIINNTYMNGSILNINGGYCYK